MDQTKQQDLDRQLRLQEFFKSKPPIWDDLKQEMDLCLENALFKLDSIHCSQRDWYAGYRTGLKMVLNFEEQYKHWKEDSLV
jgi:hypothetical protein